MKKLFLIQLCALLLIILTAAASGAPDDDKAIITDLLETRVSILSYYYGGKMTFDDARNNMAKVTSGGLFDEDVSLLEGFAKTEVDQITDFDIQVKNCHRTSYGIIKGEAVVHWVMRGLEGYWETEETYYFTAESDEQGTKLTQLKKL
ncbi:MAG: hypothetical protein IKJ77_08080 [Firmicutes bacterium]|nr:hypothetical protein [Bacillota bacterium]